jgi:hypothetical protein
VRIFAEEHLGPWLEGHVALMEDAVKGEPKSRLLNVNESEYVEYLVQEYRVEPLVFHWDGCYVTDREEQIPAERFPNAFFLDADPGTMYPRQVVTYHIPFSGERDLLRLRPSARIGWSGNIMVTSGSVSFDVINFRDDPEEIKREADSFMSSMRAQADYVCREVDKYNEELPQMVLAAVRARKQEHLKHSNILESLGVPIRRSERTPDTFAVPALKRRVLVKPSAPDSAYTPEPTLDEQLYSAILKICRDTGVEMERHPAIYADKDEETLRDHFIMVLSPHFDSVTGETFNKKGKTDILIRHESSNVFVAECKFWNGAKAFQNTIDQVLGYLTWRDSKAAVLLFVRNKELGPVLNQIAPAAEGHPCWVAISTPGGQGWQNFKFHLPQDATRGVSLAVLCFHLPS